MRKKNRKPNMSLVFQTCLCCLKPFYPESLCLAPPGAFVPAARVRALPLPALHFILSHFSFFTVFYYANLWRPGLVPCLLCEAFPDFLLQLIFLYSVLKEYFVQLFFSSTHITVNYKLRLSFLFLARIYLLETQDRS